MPGAPALAVPRNTGQVAVVHRPVPEGAQVPPRPTQSDRWVGRYQRVLLNVRSGELSFFCVDWRVDVPVPAAQYPGALVAATTQPIPDLLMFFIDTWTRVDLPALARPSTPAWVFMTREQGDAFAGSLVPLAQQVVDNLFRVPGTDDLEWSAESAAAARAIEAACSRYHQGPRGVEISREGTANFADAVATAPWLARPEWAQLTDAELDATAAALSTPAPRPRTPFGIPHGGTGPELYGARSWLYTYRAHTTTPGAPTTPHCGPTPATT